MKGLKLQFRLVTANGLTVEKEHCIYHTPRGETKEFESGVSMCGNCSYLYQIHSGHYSSKCKILIVPFLLAMFFMLLDENTIIGVRLS